MDNDTPRDDSLLSPSNDPTVFNYKFTDTSNSVNEVYFSPISTPESKKKRGRTPLALTLHRSSFAGTPTIKEMFSKRKHDDLTGGEEDAVNEELASRRSKLTPRTPPRTASAEMGTNSPQTDTSDTQQATTSQATTMDHQLSPLIHTPPGQDLASPSSPIPEGLAGMFTTIIRQLEGQSSELAKIRRTQYSQSSELAEIKRTQNNQCAELLDIKRIASALNTRVTSLESDVDILKKEAAAGGQRSDPKTDNQLESHEKRFRRNNIVISGLITDAENCLRQTRTFINNVFQEGSSVEDAYHMDQRNTILAKITTVSAKDKIMSTKNKALQNTCIFIDHDQTPTERLIAFRARQRARAERDKGHVAKAAHQRVYINGTCFTWDQTADDFVADPSRSRSLSATSASAAPDSQPGSSYQQQPGPFYNSHPGPGYSSTSSQDARIQPNTPKNFPTTGPVHQP